MEGNTISNERTKYLSRSSGIELLKIIAIFLVVTSHVVQTLGDSKEIFGLSLTDATTNVQQLILSCLRYSGALGNSIFFACSAWFLCDQKRFNAKKLLHLWLQVWTCSVLVLAMILLFGDVRVGGLNILKSFLPIIFDNNWYISCYMVFLLIAPLLNIVLEHTSKRQQAIICIVSLALVCVRFVFKYTASPFYIDTLVLWVIVYFWIAYIKHHLNGFSENRALGWIMTVFGLAGQVGIVLAANFLGLRFGFFAGSLQTWNGNDNVFSLLTAIGLLVVAENSKFKSVFINRISSLSLLAYVIHENFLIRKYYRPRLFEWLYHSYGYSNILLWVLLFTMAIFIVSLGVSYIYQQTVCRLLVRIEDRLYPKLESCSKKILRDEDSLS